MGNFKEDIAKVRVFVFDVDGVMTDGGITMLPDGEILRTYSAKDGFAISYAIKKGYTIAVITGGRGGSCLDRRLKMLGVEHVYVNCLAKLDALKELKEKFGASDDEILYMGDDIPDVEPMMNVGMPVCPSDACSEVISVSRYVSQFSGGDGCVRDIVEQVLRARGDWFKVGEALHVMSR